MRGLNGKDAVGRGGWGRLMGLDDDQDGGWVSISSGTCSPG